MVKKDENMFMLLMC